MSFLFEGAENMFDDIRGYCTSIRQDASGCVAVLKPEHAIDGMRTLLWRNDRWVTINGAHVLVGENGVVMGGAGGKFNGKNFSPRASKFYKKRKAVNAARQYRKMLSKPASYTGPSYDEAKEAIKNIDKNLKRTYLTPEQKAKRKESLKKIREFDKKIKSMQDNLQIKGKVYFYIRVSTSGQNDWHRMYKKVDKELKQLTLQQAIVEFNMPRDNKRTAAEREKLLKRRREYKKVINAYDKRYNEIERFKKKNPGVAELSARLEARDKRVENNRVRAQVNRLERTLTNEQKQALANGKKSWRSMSEAEKTIARRAQGMPKNMPPDMWDLYSNPLTVSRTSFGAVWTGDSAD